ncbi:outer membrane lipoprotein-sorting protein [Candidatus Thiosymbion oneisti]|uniref:outer membrane lipoprotein-sorting protein n=1 Tax=Candidatus Thiosymbion oneisti TaxID=589554 RepID=UPI0013FD619F|nr:outer membrane lipoprotein-sorting protein [Candidatus Thiosymbion oneisti]
MRGVAFQSINYDEDTGTEDDQWMYLPAFRQVRRIATTDKRGSFMGSEFSYYDLDKLRVHDYRQRLTGEEKVLGRRCWVIERIPKGERIIAKTGYHKTRVWVDKEVHVVLRQTYYDAKDVLFKELKVKKLSRR